MLDIQLGQYHKLYLQNYLKQHGDLSDDNVNAINGYIAALQKRMLQAVSLFYERFKSRFELAVNSRVFKDPQTLTQEKEQTLDDLTLRLENAWNEKLIAWTHRFEMARQKLNALGPQAVLKRGYSITRKQNGTIITRVAQTAPGETIYVQVQDGMIHTEVK